MSLPAKEKRIEWACRILISIQLFTVASGYVVFLQTKYQLASPLIPQSLVYEISNRYIIASLITGGFMLLTLWLYFINRKVLTIILAIVSLVLHQVWLILFIE